MSLINISLDDLLKSFDLQELLFLLHMWVACWPFFKIWKFNLKLNIIIICYFDVEMVEDDGIEPTTPCLQSRCSPSWANPPDRGKAGNLLYTLKKDWWVWLVSNQRPLRYQHSALTNWATDPSRRFWSGLNQVRWQPSNNFRTTEFARTFARSIRIVWVCHQTIFLNKL